MQQKYKVLSFAIVAALYIFLVPSTSHAQPNWTVTHTPGETAGPAARPAIQHGQPNDSRMQAQCEGMLVHEDDIRKKCLQAEGGKARHLENVDRCLSEVAGLGHEIRYIQSTGGYCYYYKAGNSSGRGGPNMWRYDPR